MLSVLAGGAVAANCPAAVNQADVDESIKRGVELLWSLQQDDGSWQYADHEERTMGLTALVALALYENGTLPNDPRFRKAMNFVRQNSPRNKDAYSVALATILLARVGNREDRVLVRTLAQKINEGQHLTGGWHYSIPETPGSGSRETGMGDLSVTQFAVLALWQAQRVGAPVRAAMQRTRQRLAWCQTPSGGWGYHGMPDASESASMTTAGAFMWVVSSAYEVKEARRTNAETVVPREPRRRPEFKPQDILETAQEEESGEKDVDKKIKELVGTPVDLYDAVIRGAFEKKRALNKSAKGSDTPHKEGTEPGDLFYTYEERLPPVIDATKPSPLVDDEPLQKALQRVTHYAERTLRSSSNYYYLWTVERLGVLLGMETFGSADWFDLGAATLLRRQNEDGSWGTPGEEGDDDGNRDRYVADTSFALLFLRKANLGSDVARLLNPDPDHPFVVDETEKKFETFAEALKAAADGQSIVIQGDGPYGVAGQVVDKSVVVRSAQGYDPVFKYQVPKDSLGFEMDVDNDSEYRHMFIIRADNVKFEGIQFQMDPPSYRGVEWTAIYSDGKPISMLNCTLSESERRGTTGLRLVNSPRVFLRNCMFNGFQPSIEADVADRTNVMLRDTLVYGPEAFRVSGDGNFNLWFLESTANNDRFLNLAEHKGETHVIAENNVFRTERLVGDLGPAQSERSWYGRYNLYDVRIWIDKGSANATSVTGIDGWRAFWRAEEPKSKFAKAPFEVPRLQLGPYRHGLSPQEWGMKDDELRLLMGLSPRDEEQIGANVYVVGAGVGYLNFRERLDYENWLSAVLPSEKAQQASTQ